MIYNMRIKRFLKKLRYVIHPAQAARILFRKWLINQERPRYRPYLYDLAKRYVAFCRGEQNTDMYTNGEENILKMLLKKTKDLVVFDVGANKGIYSEMVLTIFPNIQIHAFEPDPDTFKLLVERLGTEKNTILNNIGLSSQEGEQALYANFLAVRRGIDSSELTRIECIS